MGGELRHRPGPVPRADDVVPLGDEPVGDRPVDDGLVLDDEDAASGAFMCPSVSAALVGKRGRLVKILCRLVERLSESERVKVAT